MLLILYPLQPVDDYFCIFLLIHVEFMSKFFVHCLYNNNSNNNKYNNNNSCINIKVNSINNNNNNNNNNDNNNDNKNLFHCILISRSLQVSDSSC